MERTEKTLREILTNGIIKENPVLRLVLGMCPTLAVTTMAFNGFGMGLTTTMTLVCSNFVISLLRHVIPNKVRIPTYIIIVAGFVGIIQMLIQAYAPAIDEALGIFLPLIAVNCIILGRAESFARSNKPLPAILDGLGMGIGFTVSLVLIGSIREILGNNTWFGIVLNDSLRIEPMLIFLLPPGGFLVFGFLMALINKLTIDKRKGSVDLNCASCPLSEGCRKIAEGGC